MSQNGKEDTKILGPDYDFFERYLVGYYQSNIEGELILDSETETSKKFFDLISEYDNSKSENPFEKSEAEEEADSLAFFISMGLVVKDNNGGFRINLGLLSKTAQYFQEALEKSKAYSIGAM